MCFDHKKSEQFWSSSDQQRDVNAVKIMVTVFDNQQTIN